MAYSHFQRGIDGVGMLSCQLKASPKTSYCISLPIGLMGKRLLHQLNEEPPFFHFQNFPSIINKLTLNTLASHLYPLQFKMAQWNTNLKTFYLFHLVGSLRQDYQNNQRLIQYLISYWHAEFLRKLIMKLMLLCCYMLFHCSF